MVSELFAAIRAGDLNQVERLLDTSPELLSVHHPDPNKYEEMTPLHAAATHGVLPIVKLLVARGAEVYSNAHNSYPAVMYAAWAERADVVDYFLKKIPDQADGTNKLGVTINLAARQGWTDIVREHIARDPLSVHNRGWTGDTPLHWPAHNGYVEIVALLLDAGADIEADEINCYGGKPLHWAAEHEPATVRLLLERGANVNARNVKADSELLGYTPLIMNARQREDCAEVAELLIAAGADITAEEANGHTALDIAKKRNNQRIITVLKAADA